MKSRTVYTESMDSFEKDPDECPHPNDEIVEVVDSIGEVVEKNESFEECQSCGARIA